MRSRVAVLCLDGVEWSLVEQLLAAGDLPNLAALHARAAFCRLESPLPYRAEGPWLDFLSGRRADTRRFWSPVAFTPSTYDCFLRGTAPVSPFYAFGSERTVIALDVPKTIPSSDVHGCQVIGWGAHDPGHPPAARPPGLLRELTAQVGEHPAVAIEYDGAWHQPDFLSRFASASEIGMERRVAALRRLCGEHPNWDFLITAMSEAHTAGHQMWHGVDDASLYATAPSAPVARRALRDIYRGLDRAVGAVVASLPPETVVVAMAPMGMERGESEIATMMLVPELFQRLYVGRPLLHAPGAAAWRRRGCPPLVVGEHDHHSAYVARRFGLGAVATRRVALGESSRARLGRLLARRVPSLVALRRRLQARATTFTAPHDPPPHLAEATSQRFPSHDVSMNQWHVATWYRTAWPRMPAFVVPSFGDAHVRINLEGRERDGCVAVIDYERVCDEVERQLGMCHDVRSGRRAVAEVTRMCSDDPLAVDGPTADLVVRFVDGVDAIEHPDAGVIGPFPPARTGSHTAVGFALVAGPSIPHADLGTRPLVDLTATIAALLECPVPPGSDGNSIALRSLPVTATTLIRTIIDSLEPR